MSWSPWAINDFSIKHFKIHQYLTEVVQELTLKTQPFLESVGLNNNIVPVEAYHELLS